MRGALRRQRPSRPPFNFNLSLSQYPSQYLSQYLSPSPCQSLILSQFLSLSLSLSLSMSMSMSMSLSLSMSMFMAACCYIWEPPGSNSDPPSNSTARYLDANVRSWKVGWSWILETYPPSLAHFGESAQREVLADEDRCGLVSPAEPLPQGNAFFQTGPTPFQWMPGVVFGDGIPSGGTARSPEASLTGIWSTRSAGHAAALSQGDGHVRRQARPSRLPAPSLSRHLRRTPVSYLGCFLS